MLANPPPIPAFATVALLVVGCAVADSVDGFTGEPPGQPASGGAGSLGGTGDPTSTASGAAPTTTTSDGATSGANEDAESGLDTGGPIFDVGSADVPSCGAAGSVDFSYLWVANAAQGTVSKIDTFTMDEVGRYIVRPDQAGNPSRTSVDLNGDVVVANRSGGVTKIFADPEDCIDDNGTPGIQTSTGAEDILAWGTEECIAWHTEFPGVLQRPVAWSAGVFDETRCVWSGQGVWTTTALANTPGSVQVHYLDGETGAVLFELAVPELGVSVLGPYGGAVDSQGNFWFHARDPNQPTGLARVDPDGGAYETMPIPMANPYGIAVDSTDRIWFSSYTSGLSRFDPADGSWEIRAGAGGLGITADGDGAIWIASGHPFPTFRGVIAYDTETLDPLQVIDMSAVTQSANGVALDFEGYLWMVDSHDSAWKIDRQAETWERYGGLTGPYTYSDMTGWGLSLVTRG